MFNFRKKPDVQIFRKRPEAETFRHVDVVEVVKCAAEKSISAEQTLSILTLALVKTATDFGVSLERVERAVRLAYEDAKG